MSVSETVFGRVRVGGDESRIVIGGSTPADADTVETGITVDTDRLNKAGQTKVTLLDADPSEGDTLDVTIRGTPVFGGTVTNSKDGVGGRVRVTAHDSIRTLKQTDIFSQFDEAAVSRVVESVLDTSGVDGRVEGTSETVSLSFDGKPADEVLEKLVKIENGAWYIDPKGEVVFTGDVGSVGETIEIGEIRDLSAGKKSPAYESVRVRGSSPASRRGREFRHITPSELITATAGEGEPQFDFEDRDIQTQKQAQNVADKLLSRLDAQRQGGFVEVVGREDIQPFDTVVFPDRFGGDEYLVDEVKHTITERDGFITRISLGGSI